MSKFLSYFTALAFASACYMAFAADDAYKTARKTANETYKMDREACKPLKGDERKNCLQQAKAKHNQAVTEARAMHKAERGSGKASSSGGAGNPNDPTGTGK